MLRTTSFNTLDNLKTTIAPQEPQDTRFYPLDTATNFTIDL